MTINFNVNVSGSIQHVLVLPPGMLPGAVTQDDLSALREQIMSELSDLVGDIKAAVVDMKARVIEDIDALQAKIQAGVATPEILADLNSIKTDLGSFDPIPPETPPAP
jgi:hypothetical protein